MHKYLFCKSNTFNIEKSESEKNYNTCESCMFCSFLTTQIMASKLFPNASAIYVKLELK